MGTPWHITLYTSDSLTANSLIDTVFARVEVLEQTMSDYRSDSEINRLVALPARRFHEVSPDLFRILQLSKQLARRSRGAFDPTVGPLSKVWRRAFRQQELPKQEDVDRARSRVQWKWVRLRRAGRVRLARQGMQLDLGGIAKGYALDAAAEVIGSQGVTSFLIDGGGDLTVGAAPTGRSGWVISTPIGSIDTANVAIATSGSTYRYLEQDGIRYGHIIDPRTGYGTSDVSTMTVVGPTATLTDGLASALYLLDAKGRKRLIRHYKNYSLAKIR